MEIQSGSPCNLFLCKIRPNKSSGLSRGSWKRVVFWSEAVTEYTKMCFWRGSKFKAQNLKQIENHPIPQPLI